MSIFKNIISVRNNVAVGTNALGSSSLVSSMSTHFSFILEVAKQILGQVPHFYHYYFFPLFGRTLSSFFFFFFLLKTGKPRSRECCLSGEQCRHMHPLWCKTDFLQTFSACIKNAKSTALHSHLSTSLRFSSPQDTVNTMKKFGCTRLTARRPYSIWNPTCFESDLKWRTRAGVLGGGFAMSDRQKKQKTVTFLTLRVTPCWNVRKRTIPGQFQIVKNKPCHT